jgi:hypothetical protein
MGFGQAQMSPPAGYTVGQRIYEDQFLTTSLDTTKWCPMMGAGGSVFNNGGGSGGALPSPYTGPNVVSKGHFNGVTCNLWHPSYCVVNNGLTINCVVNPLWNNGTVLGNYQYAAGSITSAAMPGVSSGVSTANFSLPTTVGWYLQVNAQLAPSLNGINSTVWFLPKSGGTVNELDYVQPTLAKQVGATGATSVHFPLGTAVQDNAGAYTNQTFPNLAPTDYTSGFHVYGYQFIPGVGITGFVDGVQRYSVANSAVPGGITDHAYIIIIHIEMWDSSADGYAFTGCLQGGGPGTGVHPNGGAAYGTYSGAMLIAEVQAYTRAAATGNSAAFALGGTLHGTVKATPIIITTPFSLRGAMAANLGGGNADLGPLGLTLNGSLSTAATSLGLSANFTLNGSMTADAEPPSVAGEVAVSLQTAKVAITLQ